MIPKTFRKTFCLLTGPKLGSLEGVCLITSGVKVTPCHHTDGKTWWWWCDGLGLFGCFWTWKLCCDQWSHEFISTPKHPGGKRLELKPVWVLQQDNDPKHSSRSTSERLKTNKIRTLEWPSQSTDMKPIKMLWQDFKNYIYAGETSSRAELQ